MSGTPVGDHAFVSDCRSAALVTRAGSIDWLCLPRFDSPAVGARLLDKDAGHFLLRPVAADARPRRRYLTDSLVLETTRTSSTGEVIVHDAMALAAHERGHDLGRSSPGVLLRHTHCLTGTMPMRVEWAPRPEFGLVHPKLRRIPGGVRSEGGASVLTLSTDLTTDLAESTASATTMLHERDQVSLAMHHTSARMNRPNPGRSARSPTGSPTPAKRGAAGQHCINATTDHSRSWSDTAAGCCKGSPTPAAARSLPPPPPARPNESAPPAPGTTATPGSATPA